MQTTLLAVGVAIILALLTALVGPYFINWGDHRGLFEAQASRIIGLPVRVAGGIDARLLPVPSVTLRDVAIGDATADEPPLKAGSFGMEFSLGALVRGEWRATEMRLTGPELRLALDAQGRLQQSWNQAGGGFDPDALLVERLLVEDGRIRLDDAAAPDGPRLIENFWFTGDLRSLAGPLKGEGGFSTDRARHTYRLTMGRVGAEGARLRLSIDPADRPLTADADGVLRIDAGVPRFEGTLGLARLAGGAAVQGGERSAPATTVQPWRIAAKVKASPSGVAMEGLDLRYGGEERALRLNGTAELKLGARPQLEATLAARQLDLDRLVALPDTERRIPMVILRRAAATLDDVLQPTIPTRVAIAVDTLTLGGAAVQGLRGEAVAADGGWNIEELAFRAPGFADVKASGRWGPSGPDAAAYAFEGPAALEAIEPRALAAWLEGRSAVAATQGAPIGELRATGALTLAADRVAVDMLTAEIDGKEIAGRFTYVPAAEGRPSTLDAEINAAALDIDASLALIENAFPGMGDGLPAEFSLALDIGRATFAGIEARKARARLALGADGLNFETLTVEDFAGAGLDLNGRIAGPWSAPRGSLAFTLAGERLDGVIALAEQAYPAAAEVLRTAAPHLSPARLAGTLSVERAEAGDGSPASKTITKTADSRALLKIEGMAGGLELAAQGTLAGDAAAWERAVLDGKIDVTAADGRRLANALNLAATFGLRAGPGSLRLAAAGPLDGDLRLEASVAAAGAQASASGTLRWAADGARGSGSVDLIADDVAILAEPLGRHGAETPVIAHATIGVAPGRIAFDDLTASLAETTASGRLAIAFAERARLEGRLDADAVPASALVAAMLGAPHLPAGTPRPAEGAGAPRSVWPVQPFAPRFLAGLEGQIELRATRADIGGGSEIRQFRGIARFGPEGAALEDVSGVVAGGRLIGNFAFPRGVDGTGVDLRLALTDADLGLLLPGEARARAGGRVSLQLEARGSGRSTASLLGGLGGAGTVSFADVELVGLDPQLFDVVTRATDQGVEVDPSRVARLVEHALENGRLRIAAADGALSLSAGQLRLAGLLGKGERADLAVSASFDLSQWLLDARLALMGQTGEDSPTVGRPEVYVALKGPPDAPVRSIDVSALVGWLTLRSVELQARKLEALEAERARSGAPESRQGTAGASSSGSGAPPANGAPDPSSADPARRDIPDEPGAGTPEAAASRATGSAAAPPPALGHGDEPAKANAAAADERISGERITESERIPGSAPIPDAATVPGPVALPPSEPAQPQPRGSQAASPVSPSRVESGRVEASRVGNAAIPGAEDVPAQNTRARPLPPPVEIRPAPVPRVPASGAAAARRQNENGASAQLPEPPAAPLFRLFDLFGATR